MYEKMEHKEPSGKNYSLFIRYYTKSGYDTEKLKQAMEVAVSEFISMAAGDKFILLPLGIQHPMHVLTTYYGVQTALIPLVQKVIYGNYWPSLRTMYTIHFYGYKGIYS